MSWIGVRCPSGGPAWCGVQNRSGEFVFVQPRAEFTFDPVAALSEREFGQRPPGQLTEISGVALRATSPSECLATLASAGSSYHETMIRTAWCRPRPPCSRSRLASVRRASSPRYPVPMLLLFDPGESVLLGVFLILLTLAIWAGLFIGVLWILRASWRFLTAPRKTKGAEANEGKKPDRPDPR